LNTPGISAKLDHLQQLLKHAVTDGDGLHAVLTQQNQEKEKHQEKDQKQEEEQNQEKEKHQEKDQKQEEELELIDYARAGFEACDPLQRIIAASGISAKLAAVQPLLLTAATDANELHAVATKLDVLDYVKAAKEAWPYLFRPSSVAFSVFTLILSLHMAITMTSFMPSFINGSAPLRSVYSTALGLSSLLGMGIYGFLSGRRNLFRSLAATAVSTAIGYFGGAFLEQVNSSSCTCLLIKL
jgi:hypothetical protein